MIDFHSHFLPDMDDGSESLGESLQMLEFSYNVGVKTIVSTSHYIADNENVECFVNRRKEKIDCLTNILEGINDVPKIVEGAEVAYYPGIGNDNELSRLCIGNTKYILIEMPYCRWSTITKRELLSMMLNRGMTPIIAHVDRYFKYPQCTDKIDELLDVGAVAQINGDSLTDKKQRKKVLSFIKERKTVLLGSDCHNMNDRKPNLDKAFSIIEKNLGRTYIDIIKRFSLEILGT